MTLCKLDLSPETVNKPGDNAGTVWAEPHFYWPSFKLGGD